jgi:hypothetical protein
MLHFKDLDSLKKLSFLLSIPLFVFAYLSEMLINNKRDFILLLLSDEMDKPISTYAWLIWFIAIFIIGTLLFQVIDWLIIKLDMLFKHFRFMLWAGLCLVTFGLFVLAYALPLPQNTPFHLFWHLWGLCYGFSLIQRSEKMKQIN